MKIEIKYFGKIAEATNCTNEYIELNEGTNLNDLKVILTEQYPKVKDIDFKIAYNEVLATNNINLKDGDIIALLPPFAGG